MVAVGLFVLTGAAMAENEAQIPWAPSYSEAVQKAREAKKLLMVDFFTEW
jgi:hypothetical protein